MLSEANAITSDAELVQGMALKVPEVKVTANDAATFKPFDPNEAVGNTAPSLPYITPPPKQQCNAIAMVLMIVVAIVVTVVTYGAMAGPASAAIGGAAVGTTAAGATVTVGGAMAAGAVAGAAGSAASMAVGSAMGAASFSWRGVAAGAITGAITAGIGSQFGTVGSALGGANPNYLKAAGLALANAGANYAGQKLAGVDASFSWRSIAASAVSSVAAAKIAPWAVGKLNLQSDFANDIAAGMTGGMVSAVVRSSFGQALHESDYLTIAADAFGNALGNAAVRGIQTVQADRASRASGAQTYALGDDPVITTEALPESAMGGFTEGPYNSTATITVPGNGDVRRSTAIDVSAMAPLGGNAPANGVVGGVSDPTALFDSTHRAFFQQKWAIEPYDLSWNDDLKFDWYDRALNLEEALGPHDHSAIATSNNGANVTTLDTVVVVGTRVDEMGQPLNGPSNYNSFAKFGEIWGGESNVIDKLSSTWRWANYTVPDREQRRMAREAAENQYWRIDQMRSSPLGAAAYLAGEWSGASQQTKDALLATGSNMEAMLPGGGRTGLRPASIRGIRPPRPRPDTTTFGTPTTSSNAARRSQSSPLDGLNSVTRARVEAYAEAINSNVPWKWREVAPGLPKNERERAAIRDYAKRSGLIDNIDKVTVDAATGFANFDRVAIKDIKLPQNLWGVGDTAQSNYLNRQIGGKVPGYTWHHHQDSGRMQLVPFGLHNLIWHSGGRTTWATGGR